MLQSNARLYAIGAVTASLLGAAALSFPLILPFHHVPYRTAAEMAIDKEWNWGLAAVVRYNYGPVQLTNLGTLETNGIYIPEELAAANDLQIDTQGSPIKLSKQQARELNVALDVVTHLAKTRCLGREARYCPVKLFSSSELNPKPKKFVAVFLGKNTYGLVESELLARVTAVGN